MSIFHNNILAGAAGQTIADTPANITKSLRFNSGDSAHLEKTPSTAGNRVTWTWSAWVKRTKSSVGSTYQTIFSAGADGNTNSAVVFDNSDRLEIWNVVGNANVTQKITSRVFRDFSGWYHLVVSATSSTLKLYVNGVEVTDWATNNEPGGENWSFSSANAHYLGHYWDGGSNFKGDFYLADIYFIDGTAHDASKFGAYDDDNGVWQAIGYSGSYGTNGFHLLDFANESTVGDDSSGNNNDFTDNGISTSAGAGNDVLFDVPMNGDQSDTGSGGEVSGNYATLNPLQAITNNPTNGNLEIGGTSTGTYTESVSTIYIDPEDTTGYYCEFTVVTTGTNPGGHIQLIPPGINLTNNGKGETGGKGLGMRGSGGGNKWWSLTDQASGTDTGVSHAANQVIGVAVKNGKLYFAINNTWVLSGNPETESNPLYSGLSGLKGFLVGTLDGSWQCNWGQRAFTHSAPSGYRPVSSASLPTPDIADGSDHFEAKEYDGSGSTQSITGLQFSPSFVWIKPRNVSDHHVLYDTVRGVRKQLYSNLANAEETETQGLSAFTSDGFTLGGNHTVRGATNESNETYISWNWYAGSSVTPSTSGTITATTSYLNSTAGFNILKYNGIGDGSTETLGHSLSSAPELIWIKCTTNSADWAVYHKGLGAGGTVAFNSSSGKDGTSMFAGQDPTSSIVHLKENSNRVQNVGRTYIAYLFHSVDQFSSIGSYEGTGSASTGAFVFCGFRPALVLIKRDGSANWCIYDTVRDPFNDATHVLSPDTNAGGNTNDAFVSDVSIDILSNGFKIVDVDGEINQSGDTYIYYAVAENAFSLNGGLAR